MAALVETYTLPEGELNLDWFPEVDGKLLVDRFIQEIEGDARLDGLDPGPRARAKAAYVYWKAYRHIYRRKSDEPTDWSADEQGSISQTDRQVQRWKEMADEKENRFRTIVKDDDPTPDTPPTTTITTRSGYAL